MDGKNSNTCLSYRIRRHKAQNRIVMPPWPPTLPPRMDMSQRLLRRITKNGPRRVGLIIIEYTCIDPPRDKGVARQLCCGTIPTSRAFVNWLR